MTISYQRDVASSTAGGFTRLLFKWKGSLYKLIYRELLLFMSAYILLSLVYRQLLTQHQRGLFEMVVKYFDAFLNLIPLSFVLGFYVSYVASRWWQQFLAIPWPDKLFHSVACFVEGFDEDSRMLRRSLMRYMNLALILVLRSISSAVKQRFPTLEHVVEAGFMTNTEKELFQAVPSNEFNTYWIPCTWFVYRLQEASKKGKLLNEYAMETIMREFCEFRAKCGLLWCYDWVSIPMVYTQVVTLATYLFFVFTVIGRQKIDTLKKGEYMRSGRMPMDIDLYIPVYTILQFFFYMGLLKVAEQLINPFGDDDEDFELNWLVDRHVKVAEQLINPFGDDEEDFELNWLLDRDMKASFLGCDILMDPDRIPPMVKDYYWDKQNCPIPYTEASMHFKRKTYKGSADDMIVPESKQHMVLPEIEEEDEDLNQRHSKLSLTSLLLESTQVVTGSVGLGTNQNSKSSNIVTKIGLGDTASLVGGPEQAPHNKGRINVESGNGILPHTPTPDMYETSTTPLPQGTRAFHGASWRNGTHTPSSSTTPSIYPPGTRRPDEVLSVSASNLSHLPNNPNVANMLLRRGSESSLPNIWSGSMESGIDEDGSASIPGGIPGSRRGSKLLDFLEMKKRKPPKRAYKDKQGFVWRRMVHDTDDYLSAPRPPSLGQGASTAFTDPSSSLASTPLPPSLFPSDTSSSRKISIISNRSDPANQSRIPPTFEGDNASMTSFKTCPSDSNINSLVPRQVSETYFKPPIPLPVTKQLPQVAPAPAIPGAAAYMSVMSKSTPQANNPQVPIRSAPGAPAPPPSANANAPASDPLGGVRHLVRDYR